MQKEVYCQTERNSREKNELYRKDNTICARDKELTADGKSEIYAQQIFFTEEMKSNMHYPVQFDSVSYRPIYTSLSIRY